MNNNQVVQGKAARKLEGAFSFLAWQASTYPLLGVFARSLYPIKSARIMLLDTHNHSDTLEVSLSATMFDNQRFTAHSLFNLEDYVAVVTGGGTGIGLMIAQAFANNGARVYITGRRKDVLDRTIATWGTNLAHPKGQLIPWQCDITKKANIQTLVSELGAKESHVDILVNNAGIARGTSELDKGDECATAMSEELFGEDETAWEEIYRTNVIG